MVLGKRRHLCNVNTSKELSEINKTKYKYTIIKKKYVLYFPILQNI